VYDPVNSKNGLINFIASLISLIFHSLFLTLMWYIIRKCNCIEKELLKNEETQKKLMLKECINITQIHEEY